MDAGAIIAIYAAVVATGSVAWQVYTWRHRRRSHVTVDARIAIMGLPQETVDVISVSATNRSDHAVRVSGVGLDMQDGSGRELHFVRQLPGAELPGVLQPHDSGTAYIERAGVESEGISVYESVVGWVRLATGETIRSKPRPLMTR